MLSPNRRLRCSSTPIGRRPSVCTTWLRRQARVHASPAVVVRRWLERRSTLARGWNRAPQPREPSPSASILGSLTASLFRRRTASTPRSHAARACALARALCSSSPSNGGTSRHGGSRSVSRAVSRLRCKAGTALGDGTILRDDEGGERRRGRRRRLVEVDQSCIDEEERELRVESQKKAPESLIAKKRPVHGSRRCSRWKSRRSSRQPSWRASGERRLVRSDTTYLFISEELSRAERDYCKTE